MNLKRTCLCAATVVALCFTIPLGMQAYSSHAEAINSIAALSANLTVGEYHTPEINDADFSEKPEDTPFLELSDMVKGIQLCLECLVKRSAKQ